MSSLSRLRRVSAVVPAAKKRSATLLEKVMLLTTPQLKALLQH
jgi:hypothetical protein